MEIPHENPIQPDEKIRAPYERLLGVTTLALIFVAGAVFSFEYLQGSIVLKNDPHKAQSAAAALAAQNAFANISLQAHSAIVIDLTNNQVLYANNPNVQRPLASITKVAMALAVSEVFSPDTEITIPYDTAPPGSAERLAKGSTWRFKDILNFTLAASSNQGAEILAAAANDSLHVHYPQSPADTATLWRMNNIAQNLGLSQTYFDNVSGLDLSTTTSGAYGSAADIAKLFAYAASTSPELFSGTTRDGLLLESVDGTKTSAFNTDAALGSIPGLIMGKTGYTDLAGGNLAIVFDIGPAHPIVAVVLGSTETGRFADMKKLIAATEETIGNTP